MTMTTTSLLSEKYEAETNESVNYDLVASSIITTYVKEFLPDAYITPYVKVQKIKEEVVLSVLIYEVSTNRRLFANFSFNTLEKLYNERNPDALDEQLKAVIGRFRPEVKLTFDNFKDNGFNKFELLYTQ
ncbi:MAG: hypothetical protein ABIM99_06370 [Candidatus Dojkabacteria bacterium]